MSHGNLIGKRVRADFWPKCRNCVHFTECQTAPRHPAYPHTWHWYHELILLPDSTMLVADSWVGAIAKGADHTSCYDYTVDPNETLPTTDTLRRIIELRETMQNALREGNRAVDPEDQNRWYDRYDQAEAEYLRILENLPNELGAPTTDEHEPTES